MSLFRGARRAPVASSLFSSSIAAYRGRAVQPSLFTARHLSETASATAAAASSSTNSVDAIDNGLIITNSCVKRIRKLRETTKNPLLNLRIAVEGGGCSGFQYVFSLDDKQPQPDEKIFNKDDVKVIVDETSFDLIKGATIDYQQELIKNAFAIVNNPQSESACGCGSSFAVKAFSVNPALD